MHKSGALAASLLACEPLSFSGCARSPRCASVGAADPTSVRNDRHAPSPAHAQLRRRHLGRSRCVVLVDWDPSASALEPSPRQQYVTHLNPCHRSSPREEGSSRNFGRERNRRQNLPQAALSEKGARTRDGGLPLSPPWSAWHDRVSDQSEGKRSTVGS